MRREELDVTITLLVAALMLSVICALVVLLKGCANPAWNPNAVTVVGRMHPAPTPSGGP